MRQATFKTFGSSLVLAEVFGDKPFQVSLVRSLIEPPPEAGDVSPWQWSVQLPLDNQVVEQDFSSMLLGCIQVTDPEQAAVVSITAQPTQVGKNIGFEIDFSFVNASFCKRGKRKLQKMFTRVYKSWLAAKHAVSWSWDKGMLPEKLEAQVAYCCTIDPSIADKIVIGAQRHDQGFIQSEQDFEKAGVTVVIPGVVLLYDLDCALSQSGFGEAIVKKMAPLVRTLVKQGMVESMDLAQREFLDNTPYMLIEVLEGMSKQVARMQALGIEVKLDPRIAMLKTTLEAHIADGQHADQSTSSKPTDDVAAPPTPVAASSNDVAPVSQAVTNDSPPTSASASLQSAEDQNLGGTGEQQPPAAPSSLN